MNIIPPCDPHRFYTPSRATPAVPVHPAGDGATSPRSGGNLQAQVKATHQFAVHGGHGKEFHGKPAGNPRAHDGRGTEVVRAELDAQPEDRSRRDLARGRYGEAKGAEVEQGSGKLLAGSNKAYLSGPIGSKPSCSSGWHFAPPVVGIPTMIRTLVLGPHLLFDNHPTGYK